HPTPARAANPPPVIRRRVSAASRRPPVRSSPAVLVGERERERDFPLAPRRYDPRGGGFGSDRRRVGKKNPIRLPYPTLLLRLRASSVATPKSRDSIEATLPNSLKSPIRNPPIGRVRHAKRIKENIGVSTSEAAFS
uniref:Uncharacterized protein n=1 Tax=Oryza nivara TaxID=4536 RepID=A0A0E0HVG4_ORYNI